MPTIYEAFLGGFGKVIKGIQIDLAAAISRRKVGGDIVVCGNSTTVNRKLAQDIQDIEEASVGIGNWQRCDPHILSAGPHALPHYHPKTRVPGGHSFYETDRRKAVSKP